MRPGTRRTTGRGGFTLLELIVGLTITAAIFTAGYGAFGTALDRREAAVARTEADLRAATLRRSLQGWLEGIRLPAEASRSVFSGADGVRDGRPDDEILFLTAAPTPLGAGLTLVRLFVDRDPATPDEGLVADFRAWEGSARTRVSLAPEVAGLELRYRSDLLQGRPWHPSWISSSVLPAGVELRLSGAPDEPLHPLLAYPVRAVPWGGR